MPSSYLTRQSLAPTGWDSATWALVDAQLRERAFFMAGVDQAQTLQRFRTLAAQVAGGGKGAGEARALMRDFLISTGYRPEPGKEGSLQDLLSDKRRKLVLDVNVRQARGWMQHEQYKADPNVGGQELFRRFGRKQPRDWSARWIEAAQAVGWEGVARGGAFVALLDSPIWSALSRFGHPYPPFDFNSGMSTRPVDRTRCEQLGLTPPAYEPPSSFNEEVTASTAGLDADLEAQLLQALGGLVEKQGPTLRMADINGSRPYTAEQLARVLATPLPPGVPNLQAKAWAAFTHAPESLLHGGENAHLLPALRMMAARLRPEAPAALRDFLSRIDSPLNSSPRVTNSRSGEHECQATVRPCPLGKGPSREHQTQGVPRRIFKVDQSQKMHKQITDLTEALKRASRDGAHFEAVIHRPEFGELTLDCGRPGRKDNPHDSEGHGVQHALEVRHGISAYDIAETLLTGKVKKHEKVPSRIEIIGKKHIVILEREMKKDSNRISRKRAKIHTAMKKTK